MNSQLEKLEELNKLNNSGQITDAEYKVLLSDIINTKSHEEVKSKYDKHILSHYDKISSISKNVNEAGKNVISIYYLIIFEIVFEQLHNLLIDIKIKYYCKSISGYENLNLYKEKNFLSDFILEMKNIDKIIEYLKYINEIYYLVQLCVFILFMHFLWKIGGSLKKNEK